MRTILVALLATTFLCSGQHLAQAQKSIFDVRRDFARNAIDLDGRFREFDGKIADLFMYVDQIMPERLGPRKLADLGFDLLSGRVVSVGKDGFLMRAEDHDGSPFVWIKNHPRQSQLIDGSKVIVVALRSGIHQWGGTSAAFDVGRPAPPEFVARMLKEISIREEAEKQTKVAEVKKLADSKKSADEAKRAEIEARVLNSLKSSASKGYDFAQYDLGIRYLEGRGVPKDRAEGKKLLEQAAAQGHKKAKAKLDELGTEKGLPSPGPAKKP